MVNHSTLPKRLVKTTAKEADHSRKRGEVEMWRGATGRSEGLRCLDEEEGALLEAEGRCWMVDIESGARFNRRKFQPKKSWNWSGERKKEISPLKNLQLPPNTCLA